MKQVFIIILFFLYQIANGQFAVILVKNGNVNVRKTPEIGNNVIDTFINGQIIYYYIEPKGDWYEIEYEKNNSNKSGYIHKTVFKPLSDFDSLPAKIRTNDKVIFQKDSIKITLTKVPFIVKDHKLQYHKGDEKKHETSYLEKIDNKEIWGTDGSMPRSQYGQVIIEISGKIIDLPKEEIENLFEPNFQYKYTSVFFDEKTDRLYICASNSDGAGGYDVLWIIENGKYKRRYLSNFYA